ncbi:MAG: DUF2520 domain-containing protein [Bacteroidales bacterium]|nr:DUF2520 domain-containing protein [Lentimicrobiaceae bacterium]MDD5694132.1 DUF2520 domain-containing protein [Bacteroidales bacterium]
MEHSEIRQVILIGAGKVATHLALHLKVSKLNLMQVWSRTHESALILAAKADVPWCTDLRDLFPGADLYMIAVPDRVLPEILAKLTLPRDRFIVHTAGGSSMDLLQSATERPGVFYPVQTFTMERTVNFRNIPVCLEAKNEEDLKLLQTFARHFSRQIYAMDSEKRKMVHLAAVFANNFTNYLYQVSADILQKENLSFDLMKPLILETAAKIQNCQPHQVQTGPAVRNDRDVIAGHRELLKQEKQYEELYTFLTEGILKMYGNRNT